MFDHFLIAPNSLIDEADAFLSRKCSVGSVCFCVDIFSKGKVWMVIFRIRADVQINTDLNES